MKTQRQTHRLQNPKGPTVQSSDGQKQWLRYLSPRKPTYWPTVTRNNSDLIAFSIIKKIGRGALSADISYDLYSDHSAIIVTYSEQTPIRKALTNKIDWLKYKKYISSHIEFSPALDSETKSPKT